VSAGAVRKRDGRSPSSGVADALTDDAAISWDGELANVIRRAAVILPTSGNDSAPYRL
jgi:hypothetical protein